MDMPMNAQVECLDGICGQSTCLIINPATRFVTHVAVEDKDEPDAQYLIPLEEIRLSTRHLIQLRCTKYEMKKSPPSSALPTNVAPCLTRPIRPGTI